MSEPGPGADSRGSTWDNPSWSSSLSDSSLSGRPDDPPPNPWSRPHTGPEPAAFEPQQPGFDPQPTPPYGGAPHGEPVGTYGPVPAYAAPPPAYGSNPYEANPYQPAYGGISPYGMAPPSHPQASTAMIFGILGIVFGFSCGIGGLLGIPGIVLGRRARNEIDAQPARYAGRSQAVAGFVTGIIGVVLAVLLTVLFAVIIAASLTTGEY